DAISYFTQRVRTNDRDAVAFAHRGRAWQEAGEPEKGLADLTEAIRLAPENARWFSNRGLVYDKLGEFDRAIRDYDEAIRLEPDDADAYSNLAWLLATCPEERVRDGQKAVEYATRACRLTSWKASYFLAILGTACAENGNFDEAIKWQKQALQSPRYEKEE